MALNKEDLEQIGNLIGESLKTFASTEVAGMVNGAIKKVKSAQTEAVTAEQIQAQIDERVATALAAEEAKRKESGGDGKSKDDPTVKALEELRLANESLQTRLKKQDEAAAAERATRMATEERSSLIEVLTAAGVRKEFIPAAAALLHVDRKLVTRDKAGSIIYNHKDENGYQEALPLKEGIGTWLKTDEGKVYLPPVDAGGSGDNRRPKPANGAIAKGGADMGLAEAMEILRANSV